MVGGMRKSSEKMKQELSGKQNLRIKGLSYLYISTYFKQNVGVTFITLEYLTKPLSLRGMQWKAEWTVL